MITVPVLEGGARGARAHQPARWAWRSTTGIWTTTQTLFVTERVGRDPTDVECFDIAQSNSEHSRHWFFKGRLIVDGVEQSARDLMALIQALRWRRRPNNSVIAFTRQLERDPRVSALHDDRAARVRGRRGRSWRRRARLSTCMLHRRDPQLPLRRGAVPGRGDGHGRPASATPTPPDRGSLVRGRHGGLLRRQPAHSGLRAAVGGRRVRRTPATSRPPLEIEIEASNGASDYGNKFGEPVIQGYTRSFGHAAGRAVSAASGSSRSCSAAAIGQLDARPTWRRRAAETWACGW